MTATFFRSGASPFPSAVAGAGGLSLICSGSDIRRALPFASTRERYRPLRQSLRTSIRPYNRVRALPLLRHRYALPLRPQGGNTVGMPSPPPREHLDPRALRLWRIAEGVQSIVFFAIGLGLTALLVATTDMSLLLAVAPAAIALILGVVNVLLVPWIRWRRWRYEIGDLEVDLEHGVW